MNIRGFLGDLNDIARNTVKVYYEAPHTSNGAIEHNWLSDYILENAHISSKKLNLRELRECIRRGFNTDQETFEKHQHYPDHWKIRVEDLKNGNWEQAYTLAKGNKGLNYGFFKGKHIPKKSITTVDDVECVKWKHLLENHKNLTYLDSGYNMNDYAKDRKKIILGLINNIPEIHTTKHYNLKAGTPIWVAHTNVDNTPTIVFSSLSNLDEKYRAALTDTPNLRREECCLQ
jgi:hypothetical protein